MHFKESPAGIIYYKGKKKVKERPPANKAIIQI